VREDYQETTLDHPPLAAGSILAPGYEIVEHLHQSNNFDVYYVFSEERACRCIAKAPRQDLLEVARVRRGLLGEGRLLGKLTHPHIVRLYETLREPHPTLILETLTGETLSHLIDTSYRRLPLSSVVNLGLHLCSAVHYLHAHGVLHLDLKPSNIVSERGLAKILDLSIARPPGRVRRGAGTKQYMAPEQVRGERVGSEREDGSDTGSFTDTDADLDSYEQVLRRAQPIRAHRRVPAAFADAVDACLEPDPARRPALQDLTRSLEALA
jgi:serine/threonine protein kinase